MHKSKSYETSRSRAERIAALAFDYRSQAKTPVPSCNLCGSERWTVLVHRDRYGYPAQASACRQCSLTVLNPRMTLDAYGRFYGGVYRPLVSAYHGRQIDATTVQDEQRLYAGEVEQLVRPFLDGARYSTLLDVGGSTGVVAAHLGRRFGLQPTLIDPAPAEAAAAERLGLETVRGFIEEWDPGPRRFDVVGMFQTIDHLLDVAATLRKIRTLIATSGLFVVDIVDFRAAYLRHWSVEEAIKIDHPYSLTEATAEVFLSRAGFAPVHKSYSADHLHVVYVCRPAEARPDAAVPAAVVERFFNEVRFVQNAPRHSVHAE